MGVTDSGQWFSRAFGAGLVGGLATAFWTALYTAMAGFPWWSGLALYRTRLFGLSSTPVVSSHLFGAVVAGCTWLLISGLIAGALFGIIAGALLPSDLRAGRVGLFGMIFGLILYGLTAWGVPLLPATATAHMAPWGRVVALVLMGGLIGRLAGSTH